MILLENKIAIFNKIVFLKQKEECEKRIKEEKEKAAKILEDKIKSLEEDEKAPKMMIKKDLITLNSAL